MKYLKESLNESKYCKLKTRELASIVGGDGGEYPNTNPPPPPPPPIGG